MHIEWTSLIITLLVIGTVLGMFIWGIISLLKWLLVKPK